MSALRYVSPEIIAPLQLDFSILDSKGSAAKKDTRRKEQQAAPAALFFWYFIFLQVPKLG